jgi:hypothetical protein
VSLLPWRAKWEEALARNGVCCLAEEEVEVEVEEVEEVEA